SGEEARRLWKATRTTLVSWTDILRAETGEAFPEKVTAFREGMAVHGRFGQPCPACGAPVQRSVYAENECNYCAHCQTGGKLLTASTGAAAVSWLLGGAFAMGMGIWSMHFIGMLAFSLPIPIAYDVGVTIASMLIAIVVSGFALLTVSRASLSMRNLAAGGVLMGIGICSMHYTGMAAMDVQPRIRYDPLLFSASVAIAIAASTAALWIAFTLRSDARRRIYARLG